MQKRTHSIISRIETKNILLRLTLLTHQNLIHGSPPCPTLHHELTQEFWIHERPENYFFTEHCDAVLHAELLSSSSRVPSGITLHPQWYSPPSAGAPTDILQLLGNAARGSSPYGLTFQHSRKPLTLPAWLCHTLQHYKFLAFIYFFPKDKPWLGAPVFPS